MGGLGEKQKHGRTKLDTGKEIEEKKDRRIKEKEQKHHGTKSVTGQKGRRTERWVKEDLGERFSGS